MNTVTFCLVIVCTLNFQDFTAWATTSSSFVSITNSEVNTDQLTDNKKNNDRTRPLNNPSTFDNNETSEFYPKTPTNFRRKIPNNTNGTSTNRRLILKKNPFSNDNEIVHNITTPDSLSAQELMKITFFIRNDKPKNDFINLNRTHNAEKNNKFDSLSRTVDPNNNNEKNNTDGENRRLQWIPFPRKSTTDNYSSLNTTTSTINTDNNVSNVSTQAPSIPNYENRPQSFFQKELEKTRIRALLELLDKRRNSHF